MMQQLYEKIAAGATDTEKSPEQVRKKALEEAAAASMQAQNQGMREARRQGITSGSGLLSSGRRSEVGAAEAARVAEEAASAAESDQAERLNTAYQAALSGQQQTAQEEQYAKTYGLQEKQLAQEAETSAAELQLKRDTLDAEKSNTLWQQSFATKQLASNLELENKKLEQAQQQFEQGLISQKELQAAQLSTQKYIATMNNQFTAEQQEAQQQYESAENSLSRQHAMQVLEVQGDINAELTKLQAKLNAPSAAATMLGAAGAITPLIGSALSYASKKT